MLSLTYLLSFLIKILEAVIELSALEMSKTMKNWAPNQVVNFPNMFDWLIASV